MRRIKPPKTASRKGFLNAQTFQAKPVAIVLTVRKAIRVGGTIGLLAMGSTPPLTPGVLVSMKLRLILATPRSPGVIRLPRK